MLKDEGIAFKVEGVRGSLINTVNQAYLCNCNSSENPEKFANRGFEKQFGNNSAFS